MSVDIEKICRTCLALSGPLVTVFDEGARSSLAKMLEEFTRMQLKAGDNMPEKVCLNCISEINRCYSFKLKCESSNRTLRQMLPDAVPEVPNALLLSEASKVEHADKCVQTASAPIKRNATVQTIAMEISLRRALKNQHSQTEYCKRIDAAVSPIRKIRKEENLEAVALPIASSSNINTRYPKRRKNDIFENKSVDQSIRNDNVNKASKTSVTIVPIPPKSKISKASIAPNFNIIRRRVENNEIVFELQHSTSKVELHQHKSNEQANKRIKNVFVTMPANDPQPYVADDEMQYEHQYDIVENVEDEDEVTDEITHNRSDAVEDRSSHRNRTDDDDTIIIAERVSSTDGYEIEGFAAVGELEKNGLSDFTILNKPNNEIAVVPRHELIDQPSAERKRKEKAEPKQLKGVYQCPDCIMSFISHKVLKRHLHQKHNYIDSESNDQQDFKHEQEVQVHSREDIPEKEMQPIAKKRQSQKQSKPISQPPLESKSLRPKVKRRAKKPNQVAAAAANMKKSQITSRCAETAENSSGLGFPFVCEKCNAGFVRERSYKYHLNSDACKKTNHKCEICERVFASEKHLQDHRITNPNCSAKVRCTECAKLFNTTGELSEHMIKVHKRSKRHQCQVCQKVFTMLSTLKDHMRLHTGDKPFLCTLCGHAFTQNSNLRQHMRRHMNERCFGCQYCACTFITKSELFSHQRTHTGDQPFQCDMCDASFSSSSSLVQHKRQHTGERPYACEFCPQRFAALNVLRNHRRTHTGERPFRCPDCQKTFSQQGDCLMHMRTHANYKYQCLCNETFKSAKAFRDHAKQMHSEEEMRKVSEEIERKRAMAKAAAFISIDVDNDEGVTELRQDKYKNENMSDAEEFVELAMDTMS